MSRRDREKDSTLLVKYKVSFKQIVWEQNMGVRNNEDAVTFLITESGMGEASLFLEM